MAHRFQFNRKNGGSVEMEGVRCRDRHMSASPSWTHRNSHSSLPRDGIVIGIAEHHRHKVMSVIAHPTFHGAELFRLQRLPVILASTFRPSRPRHRTFWNISREGCRISTTLPLKVGGWVGLLILLPQPGGPLLVKTATVCWTRGPDCGLCFVALHPVEAARLEQVCHAGRQ